MRRALLSLFGGSFLAHIALLEAAPRLKAPPPLGYILGVLLSTSLVLLTAYSGGALGATLRARWRALWLASGVAGCIAARLLGCEVAADAFLIVSGTGLALVILPLLRDRNILVPVALVAALIDLWGVTAGPTAAAMERAPEVVRKASVKVAALGSVEPVSFVGLGDVVFVALFGAAAVALGLRIWATLGWMVVLLLSAMALTVLGGIPIPALPFAAAAVIIPNRKRFSLSREEKVAATAVAAFVAAVLAAISTAKMR